MVDSKRGNWSIFDDIDKHHGIKVSSVYPREFMNSQILSEKTYEVSTEEGSLNLSWIFQNFFNIC